MKKMQIVQLFNERELPGPNADLAPGQVGLANASRFTEAFFSEPLTTFAVGFKDPADVMAELDFLAPRVPVSRRFEYAADVNAEEFYSESDDVRSIGSDFKKVIYKGTTVSYTHLTLPTKRIV